jgi:hypothetical protein
VRGVSTHYLGGIFKTIPERELRGRCGEAPRVREE